MKRDDEVEIQRQEINKIDPYFIDRYLVSKLVDDSFNRLVKEACNRGTYKLQCKGCMLIVDITPSVGRFCPQCGTAYFDDKKLIAAVKGDHTIDFNKLIIDL